MENIFDKFDSQINMKEIEKQKQEASQNSYEEVPAGKYIAKIENMELGLTKSDNRPMFKVQMRIVEGIDDTEAFVAKYKNKKPCIFMNRVIFNTKNDGAMIQSVESWLNKIFPDDPVVFVGYQDFAETIMDCAEDVQHLEFKVDYQPDKFNSISIEEVYDA